jgi:hypothetical protein
MKLKINRVALSFIVAAWSTTIVFAAGDDFSSNPLAAGSAWSFGVGSNVNQQFTWSPGSLSVHLNSSLPTARLDLPLGATLDDASSFQLSARFSFHVTSAPSDQAANMAFGLTNHLLTGGDRTGSFSSFTSDNTFNTIEWSYFPNVSPAFGGPTLTPVVFGGHEPGGDAFANFAAIFGKDSLLNDNTIGVKTLPQDTPLEARITYTGGSKIMTLDMYQVVGNALVPLNTELVPLNLDAFGSSYDTSNTFHVDSISIMSYLDGFTTADAPSVIADMTFDSISLIVPEPSSLGLSASGVLILLCIYRRRFDRRAASAR